MPDAPQRTTAAARSNRAISPVVGAVLMIALVLLLSSVIVVGVTSLTPSLSAPEYTDGTPDEGAIALSTDSADAGNATHKISVEVDGSDSVAGKAVSEVAIDYEAASVNLSDVSATDLQRVGIDTDDDGTVDVNLTSDVTDVSTTGSSLTVAVDSDSSLSAGDSLIVEYADVDNGVAGTHQVKATVNGADAWTATFDVVDDGIQTQLVLPESGTAGTTDVHHVRYHIDDNSNTAGNSLNQIKIHYEDGSVNASNVGLDDIEKVGLDTDSDGTIDVNVSDDLDSVTTSNNGNTLEIYFTGNYNLEEQDRIILDVADLQNPSNAGTYNVSVNVNGDVTKSDDFEITS